MSIIRADLIAGARPNFMKVSALWEELRGRKTFQCRIIHTGQHFSPEMSAAFFQDLGLPEPDLHLEVGGGSATEQTAACLLKLEQEWKRNRPTVVVVVGDVTSTVAAALAAARLGIPVAHVEAGLRSFDRSMPEELNRMVTDALSDYLFASEPSGMDNLKREGVSPERAFLTGNVMIDTLLRFRERAAQSDVLERMGLRGKGYALATLHRPSNVDGKEMLAALVRALSELAEDLPVVFPVHPRTRLKMTDFDIDGSKLLLTAPMGYVDFLRLMDRARLVLTDSGGIQEETTALGVPCLTLRENTERPVTTTEGTNRLIGTDPARVVIEGRAALSGRAPVPTRPPALWDGRAAARIAGILEEKLAAGAGG